MPRRGYDRQLSVFPQQQGCPSTRVGPEKNQEGQAAAEAVDTTVFLLGRQREETGTAEGPRRPRQGIFWRLDEFPGIAIGLLLHSSLMYRAERRGGYIANSARMTWDPALPELPLRNHPRRIFSDLPCFCVHNSQLH